MCSLPHQEIPYPTRQLSYELLHFQKCVIAHHSVDI